MAAKLGILYKVGSKMILLF